MGIVTMRDLKNTYPKVFERLEAQSSKTIDLEDSRTKGVDKAFLWRHTEEGHTFWAYIHNGRFLRAQELEPELFLVEEKLVTEKINGLWS